MKSGQLKRVTKLWGGPRMQTRRCARCGEMFEAYRHNGIGRKFCSRACYYAVAAERPRFVEATCPICGAQFRRTVAALKRVRQATCSRRCANVQNSGANHHSWRGGEEHRRGPGWIAARRRVRERDQVCRICGKTPEENGQALSVDHVVPWRLFDDPLLANADDNLVALCRSCHAKKTARAERLYVLGDVLDFERFRAAIKRAP